MPATTEASPAITGERTNPPDDSPTGDPVESAIADALSRAAAAGQWTTVEVLARELGARREAHAGVVHLHEERARRRR